MNMLKPLNILKTLDLWALFAVLPVFLIADLPILGYVTAAGAWLAQRGLNVLIQRRVKGADDPRTVVGLIAGGAIGRGWLVALTILCVGLSDRSIGLAAA